MLKAPHLQPKYVKSKRQTHPDTFVGITLHAECRWNRKKLTQLQFTAVCTGIFQNMIFTEFQLLTKGPYN